MRSEVYNSLKAEFLKEDSNNAETYRQVVAASEIIFACLRTEKHRFYNARSIQEIFARFDPDAPDPEANPGAGPDVEAAIGELGRAIRRDPKIGTLTRSLYEDRLDRIVHPFYEPEKDFRYTAGQSREEIVDALTMLLLALREGDQCCALTTPAFFFKDNFGAAGRVLSAIKMAVSRGVILHWLFIINESRMNDPQVAHVMNSQKAAKKDLPESVHANLEIGWTPLPAVEYRRFLRSRDTFLHIRPGDPSDPGVLAVPDYAGAGGDIIALRVFPKPRGTYQDKWEVFRRYWGPRYELHTYPHRDV